MSQLLRKVTLAKWTKSDWACAERIPADALSVDMRTSDNALSFWIAGERGKESAGVRDAVLAIASCMQKIEAIFMVAIPHDKLDLFDVRQTPGNTPCVRIVGAHRDVSELDHDRHVELARILGEEVYAKRSIAFTAKEVRALLLDAITSNDIDRDKVNEKLLKDIEK